MYAIVEADVNYVCQTLGVLYRWKYVHVEAVWQLSLSVRHWEYFIGESLHVLRLSADYRHMSDVWIVLYVKACTYRGFRRLTPSVRYWEYFIGESMYISRLSDDYRHLWDIESILLVKVCTCRGCLTINAICEILRVFYRWKYVRIEAVWRLTPSVRYWEYFIGESMYVSRPSEDWRHL